MWGSRQGRPGSAPLRSQPFLGGGFMHLLKYRWSRLARNAWRNRQEIIAGRLSRRDLLKLGLLTGAGYLVAQHGLSPRAHAEIYSPPTQAFVDPLPIPPVKRPLANG